VLRAFLELVPDADGFDYDFDGLARMSAEQIVAECVKVQQECGKRIDKPWAADVVESFANDEQKLKEREKWEWDAEDSAALREVARSQESIKKKLESRRRKDKGKVGPEEGRRMESGEGSRRTTRSQSRSPVKARLLDMPRKESGSEGSSSDDDEPLSRKQYRSRKKLVPVEAQLTSPRGKEQGPVEGKKRKGGGGGKSKESTSDAASSPAKNTRSQLSKLLKKVVEEGRGRKRKRGRSGRRAGSSSSSSGSRSSSTESLWSSSDDSSSSSSDSSTSSSSSGSNRGRGRSRSKARKSKSARKGRKSSKAAGKSSRKSDRKKSSKRSRKKKAGRHSKQKKGDRLAFYRRTRGSKSYQLHSILSEVRGAKMEDARSVSDLFAVWAETASAQSALGSDSEGEDEAEVQQMLRDARQQLSGDLKQAVSLLPEGVQKAGQVQAVERMLISSLVQSVREQPWIAKLDVFEAANVGMAKVRKFVEKHAYVERKPWQSGQLWKEEGRGQKGGEKGAGRGGSKGAQYVDHSDRTCFACGQKGHIRPLCPNGGGNQFWQRGPWGVTPPTGLVQQGPSSTGEQKQGQ
jgi:hypothetical protein